MLRRRSSSRAPPTPSDEAALAWTRGMLLVDKMRLADFALELERYRDGVLRSGRGRFAYFRRVSH